MQYSVLKVISIIGIVCFIGSPNMVTPKFKDYWITLCIRDGHIWPAVGFVNKVLLEHSCSHSFTCHHGSFHPRVELNSCNKRPHVWGLQSWKYLLCGILQKTCCQLPCSAMVRTNNTRTSCLQPWTSPGIDSCWGYHYVVTRLDFLPSM